jgi:predicted cobalt transporter CbtA
MGVVFTVFGRIVSTLLGLFVTLAGVVWILQAFNIAFNKPMVPGGPVSFMVNNHQWAVYGAIAVAVGLAQVVWSDTRLAPSAG